MKRIAWALALLLWGTLAHAQTYYGTALVAPPTTAANCGAWTTSDTGRTNALTDSGVGCSGGQVTVSAAGNGTMKLTPGTAFIDAGAPAIYNLNGPGHPVNLLRSTTSGTDAGDFVCRRVANYTGGTFGFVNPCFWSYTQVSAGTTSFEWSGLFRLDNNGTAADASQNVAAYFQGRKLSTGSTWGAVTELYDVTANPTTGSVTDEHDMTATGTDNNNGRVLFDGWVRNVSGTATVEAAYGIRLNTGPGGLWKHGIYFNGSYTDGINLANGSYGSAPLIIADGQKICTTALCANYLLHSSGVTYIGSGGGNLVSFSDAGQITGTAVNAGSGPIYLGSSGKLCLDGATCSNYLTQASNQWHFYVNSTDALDVTTLGINGLAFNATVGNIGLPAGNKLCLDGNSTCNNYLTDTSNILHLWANGSDGAQVSAFGLTAPALSASSSNIGLAAGQKFCLNTNATCTYSLGLSGSNIQVTTPSGVAAQFTGLSSNLLATTATTLDSGGRISTAAGQDICLDGTTCSNVLWDNAGVLTMTSSSSNIKFPSQNLYMSQAWLDGGYGNTVLAYNSAAGDYSISTNRGVPGSEKYFTFSHTGELDMISSGLSVPTNGKVCLNGSGCSIYIIFDGTSIVFYNGSTAEFAINMATGVADVLTAYRQGLTPQGVTCASVSTATMTVNGGIVTHCWLFLVPAFRRRRRHMRGAFALQ